MAVDTEYFLNRGNISEQRSHKFLKKLLQEDACKNLQGNVSSSKRVKFAGYL